MLCPFESSSLACRGRKRKLSIKEPAKTATTTTGISMMKCDISPESIKSGKKAAKVVSVASVTGSTISSTPFNTAELLCIPSSI